jgi:hypothetical protein
MRHLFYATATLLLSFLCVEVVSAQTIRGRLLEDGSDAPIASATISLLSENQRVLTGALTDADGFFRISTPREGRFMLRAERIGYRQTYTPFLELMQGDSLEVEFRIAADAVLLAPITVTATTRPWWERTESVAMWAFFERREQFERLGQGRFLTRDELQFHDGSPLWMMLASQPGARLAQSEFGNYVILRGGAQLVRACQPTYYLNGGRVTLRDPEDDLFSSDDLIHNIISVSDLEAVEIYTGAAQLPGEFGGTNSNCGVVVLWTRRG